MNNEREARIVNDKSHAATQRAAACGACGEAAQTPCRYYCIFITQDYQVLII
jgi:hypothetical protein